MKKFCQISFFIFSEHEAIITLAVGFITFSSIVGVLTVFPIRSALWRMPLWYKGVQKAGLLGTNPTSDTCVTSSR